MSRYFSLTIMVKMARMLNPATPTIMNSRMLRMARSTSMAASSGPWSSSQVEMRTSGELLNTARRSRVTAAWSLS